MTRRVTIDGPRGSLEVHLAGPVDGPLVLFHHGTPGTGLPYGPFVDAAATRGLRWAAVTRPGYGASPRQAGRAVADCTADAKAVLDELGAPRCVVVGWSGGGPHALACGALLADRVAAVAIIAGVAPANAEGLEWTDGMGTENLAEFAAARDGADALGPFLEQGAAELATIRPEQLAEAFGDLVGEADRAALCGTFAEWCADLYHGAVSQGIDGWLDDDLAVVHPWGFEAASITVPVTIWQGDQDRMVPCAHGPWLAEHIEAARLRLEPGHGHLSLIADRFDAILDDLCRHL
jgi:pimeloyl-ACP methyl ester carboxylesterase